MPGGRLPGAQWECHAPLTAAQGAGTTAGCKGDAHLWPWAAPDPSCLCGWFSPRFSLLKPPSSTHSLPTTNLLHREVRGHPVPHPAPSLSSPGSCTGFDLQALHGVGAVPLRAPGPPPRGAGEARPAGRMAGGWGKGSGGQDWSGQIPWGWQVEGCGKGASSPNLAPTPIASCFLSSGHSTPQALWDLFPSQDPLLHQGATSSWSLCSPPPPPHLTPSLLATPVPSVPQALPELWPSAHLHPPPGASQLPFWMHARAAPRLAAALARPPCGLLSCVNAPSFVSLARCSQNTRK